MEAKHNGLFSISLIVSTMILAIILFLGQTSVWKPIGSVKATQTSYTLTLSETVNHPTGAGGSGTYDIKTTSNNPITIGYRDFSSNYTGCWGTFGMSGEAWNTTAITGISRVDFVLSASVSYFDYVVKFSTTGTNYADYTMSYNTYASTFSKTFNTTLPSYFRFVINDSMGTTSITSLIITYSCVA